MTQKAKQAQQSDIDPGEEGNTRKELFQRWPIPFDILTEIISTHDDRNIIVAEIEAAQEKLRIIDTGFDRLQRVARRMSGAPRNAILPDIFVGFVLPDTQMEQIAAVADQCMHQAAMRERQELIAAWQGSEEE